MQLPVLILSPLSDGSTPKQIVLSRRVKVKRQTCENDAVIQKELEEGAVYFENKVLSRKHAEVWAEDGKIYLKDTKSTNGTYLNGRRLSEEDVESDPFELKTGDIVEFGIDVVADDKITITHHKAACRVTCFGVIGTD